MKIIPLTKGMITVVDDCDYEELSKFKWHAHSNGCGGPYYAVRQIIDGELSRRQIRMHQQIMPGCEEVDHKNRITLDNRRENLRPATRVQNTSNRSCWRLNESGFRGVRKIERRRKGVAWAARLSHAGKTYFLGSYPSAEEAAIARDKKAKEIAGEFAILNFPEVAA